MTLWRRHPRFRRGARVIPVPLCCQERGLGALECAPALVAVNVVRPVVRSTLTPPARRRGGWGAEAAGGVRGRRGAGSVAAAGSGCGCSEEPTTGVHRSAALDSVDAPECPPGPASTPRADARAPALSTRLASATS